MNKIAILTWHYYNNFGSALQAHALQEVLAKMGLDAEILNYQNKLYSGKPIMRLLQKWDLLYRVVCRLSHRDRTYKYHHFRKKHLIQSELCQSEAALRKTASKYDSIIVGSDQIWAPNVFDPLYMLSFVDDARVKKVSYAASIGLNDIPDSLSNTYSSLLSDFSHLSVREEMGQHLLEEKCCVHSTVVLDPTLLLEAEHYRKMETPVATIQQPFVFCYFLNENNRYRKRVEEYAAMHGLEIVGYSANTGDKLWLNALDSIDPCEFLWLVDHASAVFTDSYHGTIFSLLFHKTFFVFERFAGDDPICQNSRIIQLCKMFGIGNRILTEGKSCTQCTEFDFRSFDEILLEAKVQSLEFLKGALL